MRSSGNGNPRVCAEILLKCVRGEVPYERVKGISPRIVDAPYAEARQTFAQDASLLIEIYEPRARLNYIDLIPVDAAQGGFNIAMELTEREG